MRYLVILFCFGIFPTCLLSQVTPDSLDNLNQQFRDCSDELGLHDSALRQGKRVLAIAEKTDYKKGIGQALNNIGVVFYNISQFDSALNYHRKALSIRKRSADMKGMAASYSNIGNTCDLAGDKKLAIEYHLMALNIRKSLQDTLGMAKSYNNMGSAFLDVPNYYKTLENCFQAIQLLEFSSNEGVDLAKALNNVGSAYQKLDELDKSLRYFQRALVIQEKLENKQEVALLLDNIAAIYLLQGQKGKNNKIRTNMFKAALANDFRSLKLREDIQDEVGIATVQNNLGNIYWELLDFPNALKHLEISLRINNRLGMKKEIAGSLNSLGRHYELQGQYAKGSEYALAAIRIADSINSAEEVKNSTEILSNIYFGLGDYKRSIGYYKRFILIRDSLMNMEGIKRMAQEESKNEFAKREQELLVQQDRENFLAEERSQKQKMIIWISAVGLLVLIFFSGFIFRSLRITRVQKIRIEEKNKNLEDAKAIIVEQKKIVDEKNKDITDSINYAKRLQEAVFPEKEVKYRLFPDAFVMLQPKDVVSGDFYWFGEKDGRRLIAAVDCTGHGVPGAFMSMIGNAFLNEIVHEKGHVSPDHILEELRTRIISSLKQTGADGEQKDGMDIALLSFDDSRSVVEFSGAFNALWLVRDQAITEFEPDKRPIGYYRGTGLPFKKHSIDLIKGDMLYIFTDGYADQFGGPKGKKFRYKQFQELLLRINPLSMSKQEEVLLQEFNTWKGELEQVDDVLVIGVKA